MSPHFYGEPLFDKILPLLIEYTLNNLPNYYIDIYTNGDLLTEKLFKELMDKGAKHFLITNYDDEQRPTLTSLANKYPMHVLIRNYKKIPIFDRAGEIFKKITELNTPCLLPLHQLLINWKGDVLLCYNDYYGDIILGNFNDAKLFAIWNNEQFNWYCKLIIGRSSIPFCKHCDFPKYIPW